MISSCIRGRNDTKIYCMDTLKLHQLLSQLQTASENISSVLDPREVLNVITKEFASLLPANTVSLSRLDAATNSLVVVSEFEDGQWIEAELDQAFPLSEYSITQSLLESKEIKQFTISDPALEPSERVLMEKYKLKSVLMIPFVRQEKMIGLVEIYNDEEKLFEENQLMMAKLLSSTAAVAFENAIIFEQLQQSLIQQKALHDSAIMLTSCLDLNTILVQIAEQVCTLLDATSVYISNYDPDTQTYRILAEFISEFASEAERHSDLGVIYNYIPESGHETEQSKPQKLSAYHIDDPDLEQHRYQILSQYGGNSVLEIPLHASGKMNAIIKVWESRYKRDFTPQEIALCETIALQASVALENAMLYQQAQEELKQRKQLEDEFRHKALHDSLTHLPNRVLFFDRLEQAIKKKARNPRADFAVFFIDLDNFKQVNDTFGHSEGDRVLEIVAHRLMYIIREMDTVSRFGGDEFLMLVEDIQDENIANQFVNRIKSNLNQPIPVKDQELRLTCSVGFTISSQGLMTSQEYIDIADQYMYSVKHTGQKHILPAVSPLSTLIAKLSKTNQLGLEQ